MLNQMVWLQPIQEFLPNIQSKILQECFLRVFHFNISSQYETTPNWSRNYNLLTFFSRENILNFYKIELNASLLNA